MYVFMSNNFLTYLGYLYLRTNDRSEGSIPYCASWIPRRFAQMFSVARR